MKGKFEFKKKKQQQRSKLEDFQIIQDKGKNIVYPHQNL